MRLSTTVRSQLESERPESSEAARHQARRQAGRRLLSGAHQLTRAPQGVCAQAVRSARHPSWEEYRLDDTELLLKLAVRMERSMLGDTHPDTLASLERLGTVLAVQGELADAVAVCREVLRIQRATLGDTHQKTLTSQHLLAMLLWSDNETDEAERELRDVLHLRRAALGAAHPDTLCSEESLTEMLRHNATKAAISLSMRRRSEQRGAPRRRRGGKLGWRGVRHVALEAWRRREGGASSRVW